MSQDVKLPPPLHERVPSHRRRPLLKWALLGVVGGLALIGALFLGFFAYTLVAASDTEIALEEGRTFGAGATDTECLAKALAVLADREPYWIPFYESSFLDGCLRSSAPTDGFCEGTPDPLDEEARLTWSDELCSECDAGSIVCHALVAKVIYLCAERASVGQR